MATDPDLTRSKDSYKVVLLGDSGVGKTSIFYRIKDGYFREMGSSTNQIATFEKPFRLPNGELTVNHLKQHFLLLLLLSCRCSLLTPAASRPTIAPFLPPSYVTLLLSSSFTR